MIPVCFCARTKTIRYYQIGLLFAHKDEAGLPACRRLKIGNRRRLHAGKKLGCADKWRVTYRVGFHTIPDSGSCRHEKLIALYSDPRLYGSILVTNR